LIRALRALCAILFAATFTVAVRMEPAQAANSNCTNAVANNANPVVGPLTNVNLKCDSNGNLLTSNQAGSYPTSTGSPPYGLSLLTNSFYGLAGYSVNGGGSGPYGSGVDLLTDGPVQGPYTPGSGYPGIPLGTPGILYVQGIGPNGTIPIFSSTGFPITDSSLTYTADVANYAAGDSKGAMRIGGYNGTTTVPLIQDPTTNYLQVDCKTGCAGSTTFPYTGTSNGQTATSASFLGAGGLYNSSPPTLTNTQFSPLQLDSSGNLNVNVKTGGGSTTFPYSGTSSGQTATTASFLGAAGIYNSSPPTLTTGQAAPIQLDVNGNQKVSGTVSLGAGAAAIGTVTFGSAQPVTQSGTWNIGTVTTLPALATGANTIGAVTQASGPWTSNITQFGGVALSTGTGASGTGIPRVTLSNDSSLAANQSVNEAQVNGVAVTTGTGVSGTGVQRVAVSTDSAVGSASTTDTYTPTLTSSNAYSANVCFGSGTGTAGQAALFTITNAFRAADSGVLESISITTNSVQTSGFKVYILTAAPATSFCLDKAAPATTSSADEKLVQGVYTLTANDSTLGTMTLWNLDGIGKQITSSTTSLYVYLVNTAAITTPASAALNISLGILQD
jgi:hypothetical protein